MTLGVCPEAARRLAVWAAVVPLFFAWSHAAAPGTPGEGRALRERTGTVDGTRVTRDEDGSRWVELRLVGGTEGPLQLRVAPVGYLEAERFSLQRGQTVRIRYFVGGDPPVVERIHVVDTGKTLRLRCLRGEPVWGLRHGRAPGARGRRGGSG